MRLLLPFLFLLFGIAPAFAQEVGASSDLQKGKYYLQLSEKKLETDLDSFYHYRSLALPYFQQAQAWEDYVDCLNGIARYHYEQEDRETFQQVAQRALDLAEQHLPDSSIIYGIAYNNYGVANKKMGKYQSALEHYQKGLAIDLAKGIDKKSLAYSYANIGSTFRKIGDYEEAVNHFDQAIGLLADTFGYSHPRTAYTILSKGNCFRDMQQWPTALATYRIANNILEQNLQLKKKKNINRLIYGYQSMARIFLELEQKDSVAHYLEKIIYWQDQGYNSRLVHSYEILGNWHSSNGDLPAALDNYRHARDAALSNSKSFSKDYLKAHYQMMVGVSLFEMGKTEKALAAYQQALIYLTFDFSDPSTSQSPPIEKMLSPRKGLEIVSKKAAAFVAKYRKSKNLDDLKKAYENFLLSSRIVKEFRNDIYSESSKHRIAEKTLPAFEGGIAAAFELYQIEKNTEYLNTAFSFAEQNKAILLLESLQANQALNSGNIPKDQLEKEKQLEIEINHWQKEINKYRQRQKDPQAAVFKQWQSKLFQLQQAYKELIAGFEKKYPSYFKLKHETKLATIEDLRKNILDPETVLLEYFIGASKSYLFYLTMNDLQVIPISKQDELLQDIQDLRQIISTPPNKNTFENDLQALSQKSWRLSTQLIQPILEQLPSRTQRLIIVPDDILSYLPFEILLTQAPPARPADFSTRTFSYLFDDYAISYNYSTTLLASTFLSQRSQKLQPFLGFAPSFGDKLAGTQRTCSDDEVYTLLCNTEEVERIQHLLGGQAYLGSEANSRSFLEEAAGYRIIHLATHACSNEQDFTANKIFFSDDYLGNIDLQQLQLKADLAVLSACNTGSGKLIRGEGVMSLSRGFLLAGCPSTLMSLWSVDDCATSDIMIHYYEQLKAGKKKDQALRLAKTHHLQQADKTQAHPYFWAAFVQSGNAEALDFSSSWLQGSYAGLGIGIGLSLLFLGYFFSRKKTKTATSQRT